jgi:PAS domain-containing protein
LGQEVSVRTRAYGETALALNASRRGDLVPDPRKVHEHHAGARRFNCPRRIRLRPRLRRDEVVDPPGDRESETRRRMAMASDSVQTEFVFKHRLASKEIRDVRVYSGLVRAGGRSLLHSIIIDVTESIRAEEALRTNERRLSLAISATADAVWEWHPEAREKMTLMRARGASAMRSSSSPGRESGSSLRTSTCPRVRRGSEAAG